MRTGQAMRPIARRVAMRHAMYPPNPVHAMTGKLVRDDPLPVGRYWITIEDNPTSQSMFQVWASNGSQAGAIMVTTTEAIPPNDDSGAPAAAFYIFEVKKPWGWGIAEYVGWPNTAPPDIQTNSDTVQKPPPEPGPLDPGGLFDTKEGGLSWVPWVAGGAVVVGGLFAIARIIGR